MVVEAKNRGMAYEMVKEGCGTISEYVDWTRSSPLSSASFGLSLTIATVSLSLLLAPMLGKTNEQLKEQESRDDGWGATSLVHEDKGWAIPIQDQESGWGERTPRDGRSGWDDGPAVTDKGTTSNIRDGNRNREPNETVSGPRKNMDPTRRKFNIEMYRLVRTVQQISHSYQIGDHLSEDHETFVTENVLAHHPEYERKIGVGVDFIKMGVLRTSPTTNV